MFETFTSDTFETPFTFAGCLLVQVRLCTLVQLLQSMNVVDGRILLTSCLTAATCFSLAQQQHGKHGVGD
jgi:hypothetical protein